MQCSVAGSSSTFKPPCSSRRQHRQGHCSCWWPFHTEIPTILLLHEDIHQKESSFSSDRQSRAEEELLHKASVGVNKNITYRHSNASLLGDTHWATWALGLLQVIKHMDQLSGSYSRLHIPHLPFLLYSLCALLLVLCPSMEFALSTRSLLSVAKGWSRRHTLASKEPLQCLDEDFSTLAYHPTALSHNHHCYVYSTSLEALCTHLAFF